ncbi:probable bifunctional dTTP/UTP pyrophosphatase/methyltransferase protein isoform X2 [Castor canadensis]|uniref:Probable bifunctional dTTP/UTP pyrophosphatase/methyltransferase protein isoform X2 n=1 Tax=Castor canadensis TaxID=51338 RepID=A0AC58LMA5_CASCN
MVLFPVIGKLQQKRVVLASASPRRQEILSNAGLRFEVVPSRFKETLSKASFPSPYAYAMETAKQKALEVANRVQQKDLRAPDVVIGADTIVAVGGLILEKPVDKHHAYCMLSRLSGKEHSVFTGVAIVHCSTKDGRLDTEVSEFYEETRVKFSELSEELLWDYIDSGEPMDKAGGYGIQALGGMLVEYVYGDFLNVVGFPLNHFCKKLAELYCPLHAQDLHRVKHDSIPCVDTFEDLSDLEGGGSEPTRRDTVGGQDQDPPELPSQGGDECVSQGGGDPQPWDAKDGGCDGTVNTPPPSPAGLLGLIDGFKASKALFAACKLNVFDLLRGMAPQHATKVARQVDASVCGTRRLLDACVALGLLEKTERGYSNTELASVYLVSDSEFSLHGYITHTNDYTWDLFTHLEVAIREGPEQVHGAVGRKDSCDQSKAPTLQVLRARHNLTKLTSHQVATAFDLSRFTCACHLGGSTGALAQELVRVYPRMKVTVFDLLEVIEQVPCCQPHRGQGEGGGGGGRGMAPVSFLSGDIFHDALPKADLYVLSTVPPEWPEDKVLRLLRRVADACKTGAGFLLAEPVLDKDRTAPSGGLTYFLDLLVQPGVREPSQDQARCWLEQLGFQDVQVASAGDLLEVALGTRVSL